MAIFWSSKVNTIIRVFNETHSILNLSLPILHPRPSLCMWIHSRHHHDHMTTTPEQNHLYVQINNHVLAIVSSVINLSSLEQRVLLILGWEYSPTWVNSHLPTATYLQMPGLGLYNINLPVNNDHLSSTATNLGSRWWSYTGLTVIVNA